MKYRAKFIHSDHRYIVPASQTFQETDAMGALMFREGMLVDWETGKGSPRYIVEDVQHSFSQETYSEELVITIEVYLSPIEFYVVELSEEVFEDGAE